MARLTANIGGPGKAGIESPVIISVILYGTLIKQTVAGDWRLCPLVDQLQRPLSLRVIRTHRLS